MKKYFTLLFLMTISSFVFGQGITYDEAKKPLQKDEIILERFILDNARSCSITLNGNEYDVCDIYLRNIVQAAYTYALAKYPKRSVVLLRNFMYTTYEQWDSEKWESVSAYQLASFDIVGKLSGEDIVKTHLSKAFDKALMNVREGSRFSIDNVTVSGDITSEINKESVKDNVIDVLLDKGYKVVAKEYLERLYQEQQKQQSGIYNENTVVQENNLSAVGYFINIKITDESLRVQVVNVSTGEYEGNATITF